MSERYSLDSTEIVPLTTRSGRKGLFDPRSTMNANAFLISNCNSFLFYFLFYFVVSSLFAPDNMTEHDDVDQNSN